MSELVAERSAAERHPVIVIPGLMGSRLSALETGKTLWLPGFWEVLLGYGPEQLALAVDGLDFRERPARLAPSGLVLKRRGEDFYATLLATLEEAGYTCARPEALGPEVDCVLFAWDWREDLVEAAAALDRLVSRLRAARDEPGLAVDLVAHSAGGLIARYYVRYGGRDVLDLEPRRVEPDPRAAAGVRRAVLIGAPNFGSIFGLQRLMRGYRLGGVSIPPELMATMPSVYELLPHPDRDWVVDLQGRRLARDLYDPDVWRRNRESIFDPAARERIRERFESPEAAARYYAALERRFARLLARGRRFHLALSTPLPDVSTQYIVMGSDCLPTPALCLIESVEGETEIRLHPDQIAHPLPGVDYERLMLDPGDGIVTRTSLLARETLDPADRRSRPPFPADYIVFGCDAHAELPSSYTLRHNLVDFLLY